MATIGSSSVMGFFVSGQRLSTVGPRPLTVAFRRHLFPSFIRASATATVQPKSDPIANGKTDSAMNILACPVCYDPLIRKGDPDQTAESTSMSSFECCTCKKDYPNNDVYLDLTVASGSKAYGESVPLSTGLFRIPLVSFLYERGWRQSFIWGGFPGPEKEFEMASNYLQSTVSGTVVDASCGSGMFSRLFAKSGKYSRVVALDFSENMLRQCDEFIKKDNIPTENITLVRADISRLPFVSSSIDAVHAGAALHCWPSPSTAVAEISRILRPGGVFVATTFIFDGLIPVPIAVILQQYVAQFSSNHFYISERELEDLCKACGLVGFTCVRNGPFIMISATKPS